MKKNILSILIIFVFSLPSIAPLLNAGFFLSDDGEWMVIRFSSFYQALADGQFPVRFLGRLNHEYGYPVANFLYPGFMYLGVPIHFLGFGFVDTIKIIFGASMIFSSIFCFLWLSKFFDKISSFIGALFYLYTPYHLLDLYKRGSVGEVLALAILPLILWQIERRSLIWSSIGITALILSHNTLAILFLPIIIVYPFIKKSNQLNRHSGDQAKPETSRISNSNKRFWTSQNDGIVNVAFGLGISSFFWIPAFFELQYTVFSQTQVSEWDAYFANVDVIGFSTIVILILTAIFFVTSRIQIKKHRLTLLLFIIGLVSVFFSSSLSTALWNILPVSFIQFPFRLLSLTIVSISFLAACIISTSPKKLIIPIVVLSLIILMYSAKPFLTPSEFFDKGEGFYTTNMDTTTVKNEYMPKWVKEKPIERFVEKVEIVDGLGTVKNVSYNSKKITFDIVARNDVNLRVNTIYYPGWKVKVDGVRKQISYENAKGVIDVKISKGKHVVEVSFSETPTRLISDFISIISLVILIIVAKRKAH